MEKAAAAALFPFKGAQVVHGVVTRTDLNGYSSWARDRSARERAAVLDAFFSRVVPEIETAGGVFFRDEGDCIVALFSDYFERGTSYAKVRSYFMAVTPLLYGAPQISAKTVIACGQVAIFQKQHEVTTGDWSSEGEPFVRAARLEHSVNSTRQIVMYEDDYDSYFAPVAVYASPGTRAPWTSYRESLQVPGLGASGGWVKVVRLEYNP